jgi:hypothetical protein
MTISFAEISPVLYLSLRKRQEIGKSSQELQSEAMLDLSLCLSLIRFAVILTAMVQKTML